MKLQASYIGELLSSKGKFMYAFQKGSGFISTTRYCIYINSISSILPCNQPR